jgi:hypothetical protein
VRFGSFFSIFKSTAKVILVNAKATISEQRMVSNLSIRFFTSLKVTGLIVIYFAAKVACALEQPARAGYRQPHYEWIGGWT